MLLLLAMLFTFSAAPSEAINMDRSKLNFLQIHKDNNDSKVSPAPTLSFATKVKAGQFKIFFLLLSKIFAPSLPEVTTK